MKSGLKLNKVAAAILAASLTSGCVWSGYISPAEFQPIQVAGDNRCIAIGLQNLSAPKDEMAVAAAQAACEIIHSQEFASKMQDLELREACNSNQMVSGSEVVQLLRTRLPDFSLVAKKPFRATAIADPQRQRIAIRNQRFEVWSDGGEEAGAMINTMIHEWTHLFLDTEGNVRFRDRGHGSRCPKSSLVSYRTGNVAEEVWSERF